MQSYLWMRPALQISEAVLLPALPRRIWWCLVPTLLLVFSVSVGWDLSHAVARYTPL